MGTRCLPGRFLPLEAVGAVQLRHLAEHVVSLLSLIVVRRVHRARVRSSRSAFLADVEVHALVRRRRR